MGAPLYPSGMSTISFGQPYIPSVVQPLQAPLPKKAVKRKSSTEGGDAADSKPRAKRAPSAKPKTKVQVRSKAKAPGAE
jgi:hypothetical protein